jgi:hypothetical protein
MIRTFAYQTKDINVVNSGTLVTEVGRDNIEQLLSLKVSGELNGTDILAIWKMKNLRLLDMSDATIVNGGSTYYENYTTSEKTIGDYFFREKENLINVILPKNTETIKTGAFMGCKRLKTILIPSSVLVDWYSYNVFEGCDSLESAVILCPTVYTWFKKSKSLKKVILGNTVKTINGEAFYLCENLESIDIPNSVQEIKYCVFSYCKKLTSVYLPNSLSYIAGALFENCTLLKHVNIPYNAELIGSRAFKKCVNLKTIDLPNSVTEIGEEAFCECTSLNKMVLPSNVKEIWERAFASCTQIESISMPSDVTIIADGLFTACEKLKHIDLHEGIVSIGKAAFSSCYSLESIDVPSAITYISMTCFGNCEKLQSITIPSVVTEIDYYTFKGCTALRKIYSLNPTPPIVNGDEDNSFNNAFEDYHYRNATLYVPNGTSAIYWLHPFWERFYNVVELGASNVKGIVNEIEAKSDYMYDLNGMRVTPGSAKKGIYIKNGKKVIIK